MSDVMLRSTQRSTNATKEATMQNLHIMSRELRAVDNFTYPEDGKREHKFEGQIIRSGSISGSQVWVVKFEERKYVYQPSNFDQVLLFSGGGYDCLPDIYIAGLDVSRVVMEVDDNMNRVNNMEVVA